MCLFLRFSNASITAVPFTTYVRCGAQESRAEEALESLQSLTGESTDVIRDGIRKTIPGYTVLLRKLL